VEVEDQSLKFHQIKFHFSLEKMKICVLKDIKILEEEKENSSNFRALNARKKYIDKYTELCRKHLAKILQNLLCIQWFH